MPDHDAAASGPTRGAGSAPHPGAAADHPAGATTRVPATRVPHDPVEAAGAAGSDADEAGSGGYSTAELLGNAALAVGALVAIWAALQGLGENIVDWIGSQLMSR